MLNVASKVSEATNELMEGAGRGHGRNGAPANAHSRTVSVLGGGMTVTGDVKGEGEIRIEGRVEGSVVTSGRVVIDASGAVEGDVRGEEVVASGKVSGNITAKGAVRLKKGCEIEADVTAATVELEEGGVVNGRLNMGKGRS